MLQRRLEMGADVGRMRHQTLLGDDGEHRPRHGRGHRISAERVEVPRMPRRTAASSSGSATIAAIGWPLPIGLPIVTRSGATPWRAKPHIASPVRAEARLHLVGDEDRAGRADARHGAGARNPAGSAITPSLEKIVSRISAAGLMPPGLQLRRAPLDVRGERPARVAGDGRRRR